MIHAYLNRLYDSVISRGYVEVERLNFDELPGRQGIIEGQLLFPGGSLLDFDEVVLVRSGQLTKLRYAYHYQSEAGELIFRYDNAPHYPNMTTYPHHKHVGTAVESTQIPDLNEILREIEQLIFDSE